MLGQLAIEGINHDALTEDYRLSAQCRISRHSVWGEGALVSMLVVHKKLCK